MQTACVNITRHCSLSAIMTTQESSSDPKSPEPEADKRPNQFLKYLSLVVLLAQNVSLVLCIRYSRTLASPTADGRNYLSSTAVVVCEIVKLAVSVIFNSLFCGLWGNPCPICSLSRCTTHQICLVMQIYVHSGKCGDYAADLNDNLFVNWQETLKLLVPAGLYTIQNNLLYVAIGNLPAAVYQVVYNLKILTTAIFSVFMLNRHLVKQQWISLVVLIVGVSLIQPTKTQSATTTEGQNAIVGMVAVLSACCLSGFAGVYFEKILKGSSTSLWIRNIQLAGWSILLGSITCYVKDREAIQQYGFFQGYNNLTAFIIFLQAAGGLIVAIVVKYSDNIIKGFATSSGIIVSSVLSAIFWDFKISFHFVIGATLVVSAVFMYGLISKTKPPSNPAKPLVAPGYVPYTDKDDEEIELATNV